MRAGMRAQTLCTHPLDPAEAQCLPHWTADALDSLVVPWLQSSLSRWATVVVAFQGVTDVTNLPGIQISALEKIHPADQPTNLQYTMLEAHARRTTQSVSQW